MAKKFSNAGIETYPCRQCDSPIPITKSQCPSCKFWNTAPEKKDYGNDQTVLLSDIDETSYPRLITGPWDPCFGGGVVTTSTTLLGGAPGAGKSTMSLQMADGIAGITKKEVFYIGAEEAARDIKSRAMRLGLKNLHLIRVLPLGTNAELGDILTHRKPSAVFLDSLPGLIGDDHAAAVALCTTLKTFAVSLDMPVIIVDHVTKQDDFAGLIKLQHAVDITMTLFPVDDEEVRELTTIKNRFGKAHVVVEFDMTEYGLVPMLGLDDEDLDEDE